MVALPRPAAPAQLVRALVRCCGADAVSVSDSDRLAYAHDGWTADVLRLRGGEVPSAPEVVVWPRREEEVVEVLRVAAQARVPVVPYGQGRGRNGGARASRGGVALVSTRLEPGLMVDRARVEGRLRVGAGVSADAVERALNSEGLTAGFDPHLGGTVGGALASRGASPSGYGLERTVTGVRLATEDGVEHLSSLRGAPRWLELVAGSEGCFGVITQVELLVWSRPSTLDTAAFRLRSLDKGIEALRRIAQSGLRPRLGRLQDGLETVLGTGGAGPRPQVAGAAVLDALLPEVPSWLPESSPLGRGAARLRRRALRQTTRTVFGAPAVLNRALEVLPDDALLLLAFEGERSVARADLDAAATIVRTHGGEPLGPEGARVWLGEQARERFREPRLYAEGLFLDALEVSATWDRVLPLHRAVKRALAREAVVTSHITHAYATGCAIEFTFTGIAGGPREAASAVERHGRILLSALAVVHEKGGSIAHHHGVGESKASALRRELGPGGLKLLDGWDRALDTSAVMNPGKLGLERRAISDGRSRADLDWQASLRSAVGVQNLVEREGQVWVRPPDEQALSVILRVAQARGLRLTSEQHLSEEHADVHVDLGRLDGIPRISEHAGFVEVEAGVPVERLESVLAAHELTLGPLHPRTAEMSIGQALAHGWLVRRGLAYGAHRDVYLSLRALLAQGEAIETRRVPRVGAGPDLTASFDGLHGEAGLITKVSLRVANPRPCVQTVRFGFGDFDGAVSAARRLLEQGLRPAAAKIWAHEDGGELGFDLVAARERLLAVQVEAVVRASEQDGGRARGASAPPPPAEGRFRGALEIETPWGQLTEMMQAVEAVAWGEVWADFLSPGGATVVVRAHDEAGRAAAAKAGRAHGGQVIDEAASGQGFRGRFRAAMDPEGIFGKG